MDYLIIGLAFSDLSTLIPYAVTTVVLVNRSIWLNTIMCNMIGLLRIATIGSTTWIHSALCIHKCLSVLLPHNNITPSAKRRAKCFTFAVIILCFLIPIFICTTLLVERSLLRMAFDTYEASCTYVSDMHLYAALGSCFLVLPAIVQVFTHCIILRKLKQGRRRKFLEPLKTVVLTLGFFYLCRIPFFIFILWTNLPIASKPPIWFEVLQRHVVTLNSGMSTIIYYVSLRGFRTRFKKIIEKLTASQVHPLVINIRGFDQYTKSIFSDTHFPISHPDLIYRFNLAPNHPFSIRESTGSRLCRVFLLLDSLI